MGKSDTFDVDLIEKLAELLSKSDLSEIEVEHNELRIRVARELTSAPTVIQHSPAQLAPVAPALAPASAAPGAASEAAPAAAPSAANTLTSPMVGTAYLAPEPGADPFVSVGERVKKGQTLLIIEAMKTMNQITADQDGVIASILVDNAQPVEFGEPLLTYE